MDLGKVPKVADRRYFGATKNRGIKIYATFEVHSVNKSGSVDKMVGDAEYCIQLSSFKGTSFCWNREK